MSTDDEYHLARFAKMLELSRNRRVVIAIYGLAVAFIFVWVPWCGYENPIYSVPKDRWNATFLGYCPVWSQPKPQEAFAEYDKRYAAYEIASKEYDLAFVEYRARRANPDYWVNPQKPVEPTKPTKPDGYVSPLIFKSATVDYGRVLLELGALTGMLVVVWMLTAYASRSGGN